MSGLRRVPRVTADLEMLAELAAPDNVEEASVRSQQRRQIKTALARLSADHRAVIELTYFHGHSCADVALILACPVGTVKSRMTHARDQLRRLLADHAGDAPHGNGSR